MQSGNRYRALALATAGLFVVAACGGSSGNGVTLASTQELRVNIGTEPCCFDPGQTQWVYEAAVDRNIFEALLKPSKDFKTVVPDAADSYTIDSTGTVYTFKLHPGAKWSDGQPVKAADFVYAWQRLLDPRLAAPYSSFYYSVKNGSKVNNMDLKDPGLPAALQTLGLKAVDDNTFQVTLEAPAGYFKWVASLWTGAPVRQDVVAKYGKDSAGTDKWGAVAASAPQQVIGNGLYKISEVVPKDHVTLVANSAYSGGSPKPTITKITLYEIDDETVAYARYKSGELDMAGVPLANTDAVRDSPELVKVPELTVFWIDFNTTKPPFDNVKVRQAFSQAVDRDAYATSVLKGRAISASTLIPKGMRNYQPELGTAQKFDPATAKATLASAGVSTSALTGIKYVYNSNSPTNKTIAEFVQAQIKTNLGIDLVLDGTDSKTVSKRLRTLNYQIGGPSGWGADYPDSQDWFDIFQTGSGNQFNGWTNKTYDDAVNAGDAGADDSKRDAAYTTAEKTLVQEAPVAFLDQRITWWLVKPYVKGLSITPNDDWLGDFYTYTIQIAQH
jgi:oligopeptide transport system substrate-binding protein